MSYGHVTMINDLPDLEDLDGVTNRPVRMEPHIMSRPEPHDEKFQKYIRGSHQMMPSSGMHREEMMMNAPPPQPHPEIMMKEAPQSVPLHMGYNCIDIARHIQDCPICSKFYNNDKTVYVIVIVVLAIICLLLLKKVLNV